MQSQKFTERLAYNAVVEGLSPGDCYPWQPLWSGMISASLYAAGTDAGHGFVYKYDPSGRLSRSYYGEGAEIELDDADYTEGFRYDSMGNITGLERYGLLDDDTYNVVDYLTLTYDGNHLVKVSADETDSDPTFEGAMQFNDESDAAVEYEYDQNGNMTKDLNRNISKIEYNCLNLPEKTIILGDGMRTYIDNTYDASGNKLRTTVGRQMTIGPIRPSSLGGGAEPQGGGLSGGLPGGEIVNPIPSSTLITTDYCGNAIYRGDTLSMLLTEEGYVTFTNDTTPVYHYYLKDHLGSVRVVFDQDGAVEQRNDYYPSGTLMYTSTNGTLQPYKFGGKELERTAGLDEYDFGARWMDPVIGGRFTTMDPMAEKYYGISPYAYCHGDPVNMMDPDGRDDYYSFTGKFLASDNKETDHIMVVPFLYLPEESYPQHSIPIEKYNGSAYFYSSVFTDILKRNDFDTSVLQNGEISVYVLYSSSDNLQYSTGASSYNTNGDLYIQIGKKAPIGTTSIVNNRIIVSAIIHPMIEEERAYLSTVSNVISVLGVHELTGHGLMRIPEKEHWKVLEKQQSHPSWKTITPKLKQLYYELVRTNKDYQEPR